MSDSGPLPRLLSGIHALIDLDRYVANIGVLRSMAPVGSEFMAVVKADAYGHGAIECARAAAAAGAEWLGVARAAEGEALRRAGIAGSIMVIGPSSADEAQRAIELDLALSVGAVAAVDDALAAARRIGKRARLHLKLDTGMHRNGVLPHEAPSIARRIVESDSADLDGVLTHFASADEVDPTPTDTQRRRFDTALSLLAESDIRPRYVHLANSAAVIAGRAGSTNLVRCGIATYGLSPSNEVPVDSRFQPVMSLRSAIARRHVLDPGEGVCYGLTYRAREPEHLGLVRAGYADGLSRRLANQGWFGIDGARCPIRGSVCMDQTVVSVPAHIRVGDPVVLLGDGSHGEMTLDEAAELTGTVNYELATRLMARVPRIFLRDGVPVAWEHLLLGERGAVQ
jgi:alanine racemase